MNKLRKLFKPLASLQIMVIALVCSLIVVFLGTMAQDPLGLYLVQERYFRSMFIDWHALSAGISKSLQLFRLDVHPVSAEFVTNAPRIPVFPGGYLIGWVLLINLIAVAVVRFRMTWAKAGIWMVHLGLVLLLLGQFATEQLQEESNMRLEEGQSSNYSIDQRETELVFIDESDPEHNEVVAIPDSRLRTGAVISHEKLPFTVTIKEWLPNSDLANHAPMASTNRPAATQGIGARVEMYERPVTAKMDEVNLPSAVLELGGVSGTWLVSPMLTQEQEVGIGDRTLKMALRFERHYNPYWIELLEFRHDVYMGTETPKNFSSEVRIVNPETDENRETKIYMNNPLRYEGATYYQASFEKDRDDVTILQVVRNPTWLAPYFGVFVIGFGMLFQFMYHLIKFTSRRTSK